MWYASVLKKMNINDLSLPDPIEKAIAEMGYSSFTAVQEMTLPSLLAGEDVMAEAPTGSGKTAAYSLPLLCRIDPTSNAVQALVIAPTRELVVQVVSEMAKFAKYMPNVRYAAIYGGQKVSTQLRELKAKPQIIVACPGRLNDLLTRKAIAVAGVSYLVLDECDEMLEMGFIKDVDKIITKITSPHQTALFSATISPEIKKVATHYLKKEAKQVTIKRTLSQENQIAQKYVLVQEEDKKEAIVSLLTSLSFTRAFVFCRTKHKVMQIAKILAKNTTHAITSLQGNLSQNKRDKAMKAFRNYEADVMVATDIAARGIDVNDVDLVVNYDIPEEDEFYLHRIGRTGRVDKSGTSYTFLTPSEKSLVHKYEAMTHAPIEAYVIDKGDAMKKYLEGLQPKLNEDLSAEKSAIEEACAVLSKKEGKEVTPMELCAILLKEKMEAPESDLPKERDYSSRHDQSIEKNKERKQFKTDPANQRFFINVGFEDGAQDASLKDFIVKNVKGLAVTDFADLYLKGTFSFFELPKDKSDAVIAGLENTNFQGKNVHIEKTERPEGGSSAHVEHKSFGHKSYGDHKSFGGHKSYGEKKSYGDKKDYGHHDFHRGEGHGFHKERH
jgi:ATP-dependent RNA helicase DeaD